MPEENLNTLQQLTVAMKAAQEAVNLALGQVSAACQAVAREGLAGMAAGNQSAGRIAELVARANALAGELSASREETRAARREIARLSKIGRVREALERDAARYEEQAAAAQAMAAETRKLLAEAEQPPA